MTASKRKKGGTAARAHDADSNAPIHSLLPMLVQYLTGLCCIHNQPDAVDIILGDFVFDEATETDRDVDVTVTVKDGATITAAFMAYEVKREVTPLDSKRVDSLCMKLLDMPDLTHRAIVSTSGFTEPAIKKATKHGISLYQFKPWTQPLEQQFAALGMTGTIQECFSTSKTLLCWWPNCSIWINTGPNSPEFTIKDTDPVFSRGGKKHKKYQSFGQYKGELLLRSTEQLLGTPRARQVDQEHHQELYARRPLEFFGPAWPNTHTFDIVADGVYIAVDGAHYHAQSVTIDGNLQYQRGDDPMYYVIENVITKQPFAGAIIVPDAREGSMKAFVFSPNSRTIGIEFVQLEERHLNSIKKLSLGNQGDRSGNKHVPSKPLKDQ